MTFNAAIAVIEIVEEVDNCEWIRRRLSEPQSQLMLDLFSCV